MGRLSLFPALLVAVLSNTCTCAFSVHRSQPTSARTVKTVLFSLQTSTLDLSARAYRNADAFFEWAGNYGISPENWQLSLQSDNWGAVATQAASAGSRVLYVPGMLRMTSQTAREQDFAALQTQITQSIDTTTANDLRSNGNIDMRAHFYLFLKVLQEYEQGNQSPYFPWMDALPRKFSAALSFDDFEMSCLPPFVKYLAEKDRYNYELFVQVLQQLNTPTISDNTKYNEEVLQWAFNVVFTRARGDAFGEAEIIPMSDMMNHEWNANCEVQFDDEGNVHVVLLRNVKTGDPLLKCYGQPTNPSRFLATYGFFDASPPATYCKLYPGMVVSEELKNLGFDYERLVFYVEDGGVAEEVYDVILYIILGNVDPSAQQQFYTAHMNGDAETKSQFHAFYLAQTCDGLLQHINDTLEEIEECAETMDEGGGMGLMHANLPMIRRHNDFVRQTFNKAKKNVEQVRANA